MNLLNIIVSVIFTLLVMACSVSTYPQFPFTIRPRKKHKPFSSLHGKLNRKLSVMTVKIIETAIIIQQHIKLTQNLEFISEGIKQGIIAHHISIKPLLVTRIRLLFYLNTALRIEFKRLN